MPVRVRQVLAIVQRADPSAVTLPINMEEATPVSRTEKSEAIKDSDDVSRYLKDVSNRHVRDWQQTVRVKGLFRFQVLQPGPPPKAGTSRNLSLS